ncbi:MAG: hypothetical protein JWQ66_4162 [Mucilaginibacter sp.]|nr:hypothetical protein [Mucilaginibacter sp.]
MDKIYRNFYRTLYLKTGGYIPTRSLNQNIYPGDFFQIRNGQILVLGNIFRNGVVNPDDCRLANGTKLNPAGWSFGQGATKPYSGRGNGLAPMGGEFEYSRQVLGFTGHGSFLFKGNDPESVKIANWTEIQQQLIIRLTQTIYSFRELYVVTEIATMAHWTLAVAGSATAELEIASDTETIGPHEIFGHVASKTIQSKDIEFYHHESKRSPCFFRAKKLVIQDERLDVFVSDFLTQHENSDIWASDFFGYDFNYDPVCVTNAPADVQASLLDMLQANQLNPNTALLYFRWADANLDDVEKLFLNYGSQ